MPCFMGRKERRQRGSNQVSYRYERCMLLPFLLDDPVFASDVYNLVLENLALFGSVLAHPKSKSYIVSFFRFLTL